MRLEATNKNVRGGPKLAPPLLGRVKVRPYRKFVKVSKFYNIKKCPKNLKTCFRLLDKHLLENSILALLLYVLKSSSNKKSFI